MAYIANLIWTLELAAFFSSRGSTPPWSAKYPTLLLTIFAQANTTITAMDLARISTSAIHLSRTAPRTWIELFWTADRAWQGPVGIVLAGKDAAAARVRPSLTSLLYTFTCVTAIATPAILNRAYPMESVSVSTYQNINLTTFGPEETFLLDPDLVAMVGAGNWCSGRSVKEIYPANIYAPTNATAATDPEANPWDLFSAGDVEAFNATRVPGIRFQGLCAPESTDRNDNGTILKLFTERCQSVGITKPMNPKKSTVTVNGSGLTFEIAGCSRLGYSTHIPSPTSNTGYFAYNYSGSAGNSSGLVSCNSTFTQGAATVQGLNATFEWFTPGNFVVDPVGPSVGNPLLDAMGSFFNHLAGAATATADMDGANLIGLGKNPCMLVQGSDFTPNVSTVAQRVWRGCVHHQVAAIDLLAITSRKMTFSANSMTNISARVRVQTFASITHVLLGVWAALIFFLTAVAWRKASTSALDTYTATSLVRRRAPWLVQESDGDELVKNPKMRLRFRGNVLEMDVDELL